MEYYLDPSEIKTLLEEGEENYKVNITIEMVEAGNIWRTFGFRLVGTVDSGNDFDALIDVTWLTEEEEPSE